MLLEKCEMFATPESKESLEKSLATFMMAIKQEDRAAYITAVQMTINFYETKLKKEN